MDRAVVTDTKRDTELKLTKRTSMVKPVRAEFCLARTLSISRTAIGIMVLRL